MRGTGVKEQKNLLREKYRDIRRSLSPDEKLETDAQIRQRLMKLYQYKNARVVMTYVSKGNETDTLELIRAALLDGKQVSVPRCVEGSYEMRFYYINSLQQLEKSSFGVYEPVEELCKLQKNFRNSICIVPGLAFDSRGFRLGYGKGYQYAHDYAAKLTSMQCLPDSLLGREYFRPTEQGLEAKYKKRLEEIKAWKKEH